VRNPQRAPPSLFLSLSLAFFFLPQLFSSLNEADGRKKAHRQSDQSRRFVSYS